MAKRNQAKIRSNIRHLVPLLNARSSIAKQYRTIWADLQFGSIDEEMKSLLVTSSASDVGIFGGRQSGRFVRPAE